MVPRRSELVLQVMHPAFELIVGFLELHPTRLGLDRLDTKSISFLCDRIGVLGNAVPFGLKRRSVPSQAAQLGLE